MAAGDVPPDEMSLLRSRDPLDAALRGEVDDPAVGALVRDLRSAYLPEGTRTRSDALVAFAGRGDGVPVGAVAPGAVPAERAAAPVERSLAPVVPIRRQVAVGVAAFAATMTGKVVLSGAVAAATLGGLHATEVVDVPLLPRSAPVDTSPVSIPDAADVPDPVSELLGPSDGSSTDAGDRDPDLDESVPAEPTSPADPQVPAPAPAAPSDDRVETDDDTPGEAPSSTPASAPPPSTTQPPATAGPEAEQPPASGPQGEEPGAAPQAEDAGERTRPAEDQQPPAPATDDQKAPARP